MEKIFNNEIVDSAKKAIADKFDSSLYGTFIIYWLIFHWRFVYTIFFVSEDMVWNSMQLFKNDYLVRVFFDYKTFNFWLWWAIPVILTILTIWVFPRLFIIRAYKRELEDAYEKKKFKVKKEKELESEEAKREEETTKKITAVAEQVEQQKKIKDIDPTIQWEEEYQTLKTKKIFGNFKTLYQIVYENGGGIYGQQSYTLAMPLIAYLDSTEALVLENGTISLKPKGNFFMRKYLEEIT